MNNAIKDVLKPKKVYRLFRDKQIDELSTIDNLIFIIKQSNKDDIRLKSLDYIKQGN